MLPDLPLRPATWDSLEAVTGQIKVCTQCALARDRTNAVPGEGSLHPTIMFIGEGPGFNEDQQGRPFVGRAGELLEELLSLVPLRREDVYITNVIKCRPPDNRDPLPNEVAACRPYLEAQIAFLSPRVIATLGRHSLAWFFPQAKISEQHGRAMRWRNTILFPLYHPAAGLRSTRLRQVLEVDFRKLPEAVLASLEIAQSTETRPVGLDAGTVTAEGLEQAADEDSGSGADGESQLPLF